MSRGDAQIADLLSQGELDEVERLGNARVGNVVHVAGTCDVKAK
jgi:hypothetical protein